MLYRAHSRWAPLRAAAWFALGFIFLRLAYRVVFLGANGSGVVLWNVRPIHLDGPFRMISLFGPVTTGGLWSSVVDALPFALGIVLCGLAFALLDVRRFLALAARARFARGILTALAIGVSTYPALVRTWRSMRQVHRLRRERGGFSTLGPLFERTLERASTLGASMETRGFSRQRGTRELECATPASIRSISLIHGLHTVTSVESVDFALGDFTLLTGATGSGKSTLLRALAGLHSLGANSFSSISSSFTIGGVDRREMRVADSAGFIGYVPQNVRDSFVAATVRDELSFGLISQGFSTGAADVRVREIVGLLRCDELIDRDTEALSSGEAVLVALGAALVTRPTLLLLDEPFADLDAHQARYVREVLARLVTTTQMSVVVAEHRVELVAPVATKRLHISGGSLREVSTSSSADLTLSRASGRAHITALTGPNGSGKTTALVARALADPTRVALVPEYLSDFFVRDSVSAECSRSDHTARVPRGTTLALFTELLSDPEIALSQHPRDLSAGQQLALAIAVQCVAAPDELFIDEPTRGLDASMRHHLAGLLERCSTQSRITIATHDADFVSLLRAQEVTV